MPRIRSIAVLLILAAISVWLTARAAPADSGAAYDWKLPKGFPKTYVPVDNPMTTAKVELGRYLFYDTRMSVNGKASCATCHKQELAFTDGKAVAEGATGEHHSRSAMSLVNVAYSAALTWSNPQMKALEEQAMVPMFGDHPIELGLKEGDGFLPMLRSDPKYRVLFEAAYPAVTDRFTIPNVTRAIASFERSIISARTPYDRYHYFREDGAITDAAKRGEVLFFDQRLSCFRCHGGFNFSDATASESATRREVQFHNTGLYNAPGLLSYPAPNVGIYEYTKAAGDVGKFKAPTLRNIAVTGPYMHDGSIGSLADVLEHYATGGRAHDNPNKDPLIGGFPLTPQDRIDLIAFLESLTEREILADPRFQNPWP